MLGRETPTRCPPSRSADAQHTAARNKNHATIADRRRGGLRKRDTHKKEKRTAEVKSERRHNFQLFLISVTRRACAPIFQFRSNGRGFVRSYFVVRTVCVRPRKPNNSFEWLAGESKLLKVGREGAGNRRARCGKKNKPPSRTTVTLSLHSRRCSATYRGRGRPSHLSIHAWRRGYRTTERVLQIKRSIYRTRRPLRGAIFKSEHCCLALAR